MHSYHELQKTDAFWEDGIAASSHNNIGPNFGWKCVIHVTVKWLPGLSTLTISKSHKGLELCAVRAGYILSVHHKLTIHSTYQQSINTDHSLPLTHKIIISGEQKDRQNCNNIFTIEAAACFGLCIRQYQIYRRIIA